MSRSLGLANLAWGPLAGGLLSGKYLAGPAQQGSRLQVSDRRLNERNLTIAATVVEVAAELGVAPAPLALRWLLEQPSRPIPILGARTAAQLREQLACLRVELPRDALVRLDRASEVPLGYPHEFLARIRAAYAS